MSVAPAVLGRRAQSEVLGSMLLVAVVVITASIVGLAVFSEVVDRRPQVSAVVEAEVTADAILIDHNGGERLPSDNLEIHYRSSESASVVPFDDPEATVGDGDRWFEPGERWNYTGVAFDTGQHVDVLLVHTDSNTVLYEGTRIVGPPS